MLKDTIMSKSIINSNQNQKLLKSLADVVPNQVHIRLDICNDFVLPESWEFTDRINDNYHFAFIKSGSGSYEYDSHKIPFEPGRLYLFGRHCKHSRILDPNDLPRTTLIRFSLLDNHTLLPAKHLMDGNALSYVTRRFSFFIVLFDRLFSYYKEDSPSGAALCQIILSQIIHEMYRDIFIDTQSTRIDPRLKKAHTYIIDNFTRKIQLNQLVHMSGLSRNYFLKLFKKCYGTTPKQIQIKLRIDTAINFLLETDYSISEISELLGYEDQFCFSKQFSEVTASSPSKLRKSYVDSCN